MIATTENPVVHIDCRRVKDDATLHDLFSEVFGFPGFYGRNWDAWIDCMTSLDEKPVGAMSAYAVPSGAIVTLHLDHFGDAKATSPTTWETLIDCAAFVNYRRVERGEPPILALSYWEH